MCELTRSLDLICFLVYWSSDTTDLGSITLSPTTKKKCQVECKEVSAIDTKEESDITEKFAQVVVFILARNETSRTLRTRMNSKSS